MVNFDKEYMLENPMYIHREAEKVPLNCNRIQKYIDFICGEVIIQNRTIEKLEKEGKDTTHAVYKRDYMLSVLGLEEAPERYWQKK